VERGDGLGGERLVGLGERLVQHQGREPGLAAGGGVTEVVAEGGGQAERDELLLLAAGVGGGVAVGADGDTAAVFFPAVEDVGEADVENGVAPVPDSGSVPVKRAMRLRMRVNWATAASCDSWTAAACRYRSSTA
jgi:hypothetical protein